MSGYRDDRRDRGRDYDRERSPARYQRGNERRRTPPGQGNGQQRIAPTEQEAAEEILPDLPNTIPVPESGRLLGLKQHGDRGTLGRPVKLIANHFVIQSLPVVKTFQYDIRFSVPASSQKRGIEKVTAMQQAKAVLKAQKLFGVDFVFDSVSLGWSRTELFPVNETRSTIIDLDNHSLEKPNQIQITMRNTGTLNIKKFVHYLMSGRSKANRDPEIEDCFKWLNAVFKKDPSERFFSRPKSTAFFYRGPDVVHTLQSTGGILEAIRGIHQAVAVCFGQLSINVDVLTCAFYVPNLRMTTVARALSGMSSEQQLKTAHEYPMFIEACSRMIHMFVVVHHLDAIKNSRKMRIQSLSRQGARETTFEELDHSIGQTVTTSIFDYFRKKYYITLHYPDLPLLVTKFGSFPMELAFTAEGERYKEQLQGAETKDFIKFATAPANVRADQVMRNVRRLKWHTLPTPKTMGLCVSAKMIDLNGRVLPCPIPLYKVGTERTPPNLGSWNLRGKVLISPVEIKSWGLVYFPGTVRMMDNRALEEFKKALAISLASLGIRVPNKHAPHLKGNPQGDLKEIISNVYAKTGSNFDLKPDILFFLVHDGASSLIYRVVKSFCEVDMGVASQVMIKEKATSDRGQAQYFANIGLKVNLKLGGWNTLVDMPRIKENLTMMLGADSSHPSPGELRRMPPPPSYSALVGSYDAACVRYTAVASVQPATDDLISNFKHMAVEVLKRFYSKNQKYPKSIMFFRDGISESQIPAFIETEVKGLRGMS